MLSPRSFLVDTNVWVDFFLGERGRIEEIKAFFFMVEQRQGTLLYAPTTLKDVFYLLPRRLKMLAGESSAEVENVSYKAIAWESTRLMTEIAAAATQSLAECDMAWMMRGTHDDLEDNLLIAAGEHCGADFIVTYDRELLERFPTICCTPSAAKDLLSAVKA